MEHLKARTKAFAVEMLRFCEHLPPGDAMRIAGRQLMRAATSVGEIIEEIDSGGRVGGEALHRLHTEANELLAIVVASIRTARRNH